MQFFAERRKRRAIASYVRGLPRRLAHDYGPSQNYTAAQIVRTLERYKFSREFEAHAVALFTDAGTFLEFRQRHAGLENYDLFRLEVFNQYFEGRRDVDLTSALGTIVRDAMGEAPGTTTDIEPAHSGHESGGWSGSSG